jgi:hypothetical protein
MMYEIRTKWTNLIVYRTTERANAVYWLERITKREYLNW